MFQCFKFLKIASWDANNSKFCKQSESSKIEELSQQKSVSYRQSQQKYVSTV